MTIKLLSEFLLFLALHRLYAPTQAFGPRWGSMLRYGIGYVAACACGVAIMRDVHGRNEYERSAIALALSALASGGGTLAGHLMDGKQ